MPLNRFVAMQWLAIAATACLLLYLLGPILAPFVAAAILAYICNPLVRRLQGWKLSRTAATALVMAGLAALFVALLLIMLPLLEKEIAVLMLRLPEWFESSRQRLLPLLQQWFGTELQWDGAAIRELLLSHLQGAGGVAAKLMPALGQGGGALVALAVNLLLIPVAMFYLLRDWDELVERIDNLVPRHWHAKARVIAAEIDAILAEFLRGQLSVMLLMSLFYVLALWIVGLEFALPIGLVAGLLVFVPYLGVVTGVLLATLAAAMQFGTIGGLLPVWGVFAAGQLIEGMVVTPWLVGDRIGLHPLAVVFALMAFGQLFGFFGVLLALPLAAILLVGLRQAKAAYLASSLYGKA